MAAASHDAIASEIADVLAVEVDAATADRCAAAISRHFAGCQVYFPRAAARHSMEAAIRKAWNGDNADALIRRFQISRTTFYRIVQ